MASWPSKDSGTSSIPNSASQASVSSGETLRGFSSDDSAGDGSVFSAGKSSAMKAGHSVQRLRRRRAS